MYPRSVLYLLFILSSDEEPILLLIFYHIYNKLLFLLPSGNFQQWGFSCLMLRVNLSIALEECWQFLEQESIFILLMSERNLPFLLFFILFCCDYRLSPPPPTSSSPIAKREGSMLWQMLGLILWKVLQYRRGNSTSSKRALKLDSSSQIGDFNGDILRSYSVLNTLLSGSLNVLI